MFINRETDYAIRIVDCLAAAGKRLDAAAISGATGVTLRFSLKILRSLAAGGIVKSYKGVRGGYELSRPPGEISVLQVYTAMCGELCLNQCAAAGYRCSRPCVEENGCEYREVFSDLARQLARQLDAVTFAET